MGLDSLQNDPSHFRLSSRRGFLHVGFLGSVGLSLGKILEMEARAEAKQGRKVTAKASSVIHIVLGGGMAAQESFDPKINAPAEYRGPYRSIKTALTGVHFSELMKETAKVADKLCIIRAMSHGEAAHERGTHNMMTGYRPSPALHFPSMGSVVSHELGPRNNLPPYVCVPKTPNIYAGTGYLSSSYSPFSLGDDPAKKNFQVRDLDLHKSISTNRFENRRGILKVVDAHFRGLESSDNMTAMGSFYDRAYSLISSPEAKKAFDINAEDDKLRDRYGRNEAGQRLLMARRLVENGVRFVTLSVGGWDHHNDIKSGFDKQMPNLDRAYATLITDLAERGMLENTLVLLTTEFGRTPKINANAGRDHYPKVFSISLAGGGLKQGFVYGKSDATSTQPDEDPLSVSDYASTIYNLIGIDSERELMSPGARPIEIVKDGSVVTDLLA